MKVGVFDPTSRPHCRPLVLQAVARLRQFAPNPIQVRVGTEAGDKPGKAIAPLSRAQVAPQAHHDERIFGQRLREGHGVRPVVDAPKNARCDAMRFGTFTEQTRLAALVQPTWPAGAAERWGWVWTPSKTANEG